MRAHIRLLLLVLVALAACSPLEPSEPDQLQAAIERWQTEQPPAYDFVYQRGGACECLVEWLIPMRILVYQGVIVGVVDERTGQAVPADVHEAPTIDGLLDWIGEWVSGPGEVSAFYDHRFGYPTYAELRSPYPDGSASFSITEFRIRPALTGPDD